ncbi:MAG: ATP-dependent Clp protease ATP-binding subunit [Patescibacteria group bacterium]|nr:ATP-dependent Clp protease ATP-binding subunit [Patescibacteria group bacterium]
MSGSKLTEKFTERAKKTISIAAEEAKNMGSPYIDTEHLLLGILCENEGIACKILNNFSLDLGKVRELVFASTDNSDDFKFNQEGFSESAREALAAAALQAYLWNHPYIGTEHILCGLAKTSSGLACHILRSYGLDYKTIIEKVSTFTNYPSSILKNNRESRLETPLINTYGRDLTALVREGKLDPVIGRDTEINRCLQILGRRTKNNPVLLGEAGVGKTAIVEGLAQKISSKQTPSKFHNLRLINLDLNSLVAGTRFRGDFEERLVGVLEEIKEAKNIILFIDELHNLIGAGSAGGAMDAANMLKPFLARSEIRCIGATTLEEYSHFIEDDAALERRFQPILINEPEEEMAVKILEGLKVHYEVFHKIKIKKEALGVAVGVAKRYFADRHLPDSAIDLIDEAFSKKSLSVGVTSRELIHLQEELEKIQNQKSELVKREAYEEAVKLRNQELSLQKKLAKMAAHEKRGKRQPVIDSKDILEIAAEITEIPLEEMTSSEAERLLNLEKELGKRVVGQEQALETVSKVLRRHRAGLTDPNRPIGSFIFLGPTGVGKTLLAKALAETIFGSSEFLIRLDMSEFSEKHTVSRLLGAPPGYVGYEEGGELAERLRHRPYAVILLDEIEKAHPEVFNILLQVLEDGRLVDGRGREINFKNTIILMTSNIGAESIKKGPRLGFGLSTAENSYDAMKGKLLERLKGSFRPEFVNRVDNIVVFKMLEKKAVREVARLIVGQVQERLKRRKITLKILDEVWQVLEEQGFSLEYGARPMRRLVQEIVEEPLSEKILAGEIIDGAKVSLGVKEGRVVIL